MAEIKVDTGKLRHYSQRLSVINSRIAKLDRRMNSLYARVKVRDLGNLIQANVLTGYSWRLLRCQNYLSLTASDFEAVENKLAKQDPLDFSKPANIDGVAEVVYDVGKAVQKKAEKVKKTVDEAVQWAADSYINKGEVYKWVQYGKAALKAAKGVVKIAKSVALIAATGGTAAPLAVLSIIMASNDIYNSIMDATYTYVGEYDKIGTNALKEKMAEAGEIVGEALGNKKAGENVGKIFYYGSDIISSVASLTVDTAPNSLANSYDKVKQLTPTNFTKMSKELKDISNLDISKIFTMDMETLKYNAKLAGYAFEETTNFVKNVGSVIKVGEKAISIGKTIDKVITVGSEGHKNPVIKVFDTIYDVKGKIEKGINISSKITKFVFG